MSNGESSRGELLRILELSHSVELKLLDFLTSQMDCELISHNMNVVGHKKRVQGILQMGRDC